MSFEDAEAFAAQATPDFHAGLRQDPDDESSPVAQVQAAIRTSDGIIDATVSSFHAVDVPGDENSYDDALAQAVSEAKSNFIDYLRDEFDLSYTDAEDIVDANVSNPDMPVG